MIPKIIHHATDTNSWEERRIIAETKKILPDFDFKLWNMPKNVELMERHFPQYMDEFKGFKAGVIRVDVARCLYMYEYGGIYVDTDYRFLKPLDETFLFNHSVLGIEEHENAAVGGGRKVGNAFMASAPGFELWPAFIESIFERHKKGEERVVFLSGPHALSIFLKQNPEFESSITFMPPETIYPPFRMAKLKTYRDETTIGAHLCWGSWRNKGLVQGVKSRARRIISAVI